MKLLLREGRYLVKIISSQKELESSWHLRHEVFCEELEWVLPSQDRKEKDSYDAFSSNLGVFDEKAQIVSCVRLITSSKPFMIEKEFACLLPRTKQVKKTIDTVEVTRLCVKKEARHARSDSYNISQILYKGVYQWSLYNSIRHLVMVVEEKYYRLLRLGGFPVRALNKFLPMGGGVKAGVIILDWRSFERENKSRNPILLDWMSRRQSHAPLRLPPHGSYLQP